MNSRNQGGGEKGFKTAGNGLFEGNNMVLKELNYRDGCKRDSHGESVCTRLGLSGENPSGP